MAISGMQKMFNRVVRHVRKQRAAAISEDGRCCYRTPEGLRCGIGGIIPNKLYKKTMEGLVADFALTENPKLRLHFQKLYGVNEKWKELMNDLQFAHDHHLVKNGMGGFEEKIAFLARKYDLKVPK
jgi:hypothetical protein